jgi:membrane-bound lytic murein transglycosylase A
MPRHFLVLALALLISACAHQESVAPQIAPPPTQQCVPGACPPPAACPVCPVVELPKPAAMPFAAARWEELPGWPGSAAEGLAPAFKAFLVSCNNLQKQAIWQAPCASAQALAKPDEGALKAWFESQMQPWQLVNPDGSREGLITGYYEPILKGSRSQKKPYLYPIYGVPPDLIDVELGELYPELKHMRLRGRIEGRKLVPYYSRADWDKSRQDEGVLLWADDALEVFFMQIQGSGQVQLDDGSRVRVNYADQNGHPYRSIGRWLVDQGEIKLEQASMQGIRAWLREHPKRMQELLNANPSYVFFRELALDSESPPGALGLPLTAERSIAVDPKYTPLGVPVWLATTYPNSEQPLTRLMLAQDTGGAIRGVVRADFFWGSGHDAGAQAGKMRQKGQMWTLLPRAYSPLTAVK